MEEDVFKGAAVIRLVGDILFGIGWVVGGIKFRLRVYVEVPERYRRG